MPTRGYAMCNGMGVMRVCRQATISRQDFDHGWFNHTFGGVRRADRCNSTGHMDDLRRVVYIADGYLADGVDVRSYRGTSPPTYRQPQAYRSTNNLHIVDVATPKLAYLA